MTIQIRRFSHALPILALLALLGGCSTYSGEKLGVKDQKLVEPHGIPYTLARAEYSLTRTPPVEGQKQPTYVIGVSYEPDPNQKYSLKLSPGKFADPNFLIKLGAGGTMLATTVTFTDQVTPAITALGSFAKDLTGVLGLHVFDKDSIRKQVKSALGGEDCSAASDLPLLSLPSANGSKPDTAPKIAAAMSERIDSFKDDDEFANLFHYITQKERGCLVAARNGLDTRVTNDHKPKINAWETARDEYLKKYPNDAAYVARLTRAVTSMDTKAMDEIKAGNAAEKDNELATRRSALFTVAGPAVQGRGATDALAKLEYFINMDSPTWRARNLLYLERELDRMTLLVLRRPDLSGDAEVAKYFLVLRRQRAETIGAAALYQRSVVLSKFVEAMQYKSVPGGKAPATAEYATARAELDAVTAQIDAQRTRVLADAKPAPAPQAPALKAVTLRKVTEKEIEASKAPNWSDGEGAKAPEYVLVLMEAP